MARYRMAMRPINRIKHVVDTNGTGPIATQLNLLLVNTKDAPVLANTSEVVTGSKVNGIYLKVEVATLTGVPGAVSNIYLSITKSPGGNLVIPPANAVGSDDNKRFVIHQEMINMQNQTGGNARILFNGVIKIPKGYARNGPNDQLYVSLKSPAVTYIYCVQCHYKEFR